MSKIQIQCEHCSANMVVSAKAIGKKIRCPKCQSVVVAVKGDDAVDMLKDVPEELSWQKNADGAYVLTSRLTTTNENQGQKQMKAPEWYYMNANSRDAIGPITPDKLRELAEKGTIGPESLIWKETLKDWVTANSFKGFREIFATDAKPAKSKPPKPSTAEDDELSENEIDDSNLGNTKRKQTFFIVMMTCGPIVILLGNVLRLQSQNSIRFLAEAIQKNIRNGDAEGARQASLDHSAAVRLSAGPMALMAVGLLLIVCGLVGYYGSSPKCPECGGRIAIGARKCRHCGSLVVQAAH